MPKLINSVHDRFFKKSMENINVVKDFFEKNLPHNILSQLDLSTLEFQNPAKISQWLKLTEADVLYSVSMHNKQKAYFYLLVEHQSTHAPMMPFRVLVYQVDTMKWHHERFPKEPLPIVYPLVLYSGKSKWTTNLDIFELFGDSSDLAREILFKPFKLIDLHRIDDNELKKQLWAGIFQFAMKHRKAQQIAQILKTLLLWIRQLHIEYDDTDLARVVLYYLVQDLDNKTEKIFVESVKEFLPEDLGEEAMTLAEKWKNDGRKEGLKEAMTLAEKWKNDGRQEGLKEAMTLAEKWKNDGRQEGHEKGILETRIETARNMLSKGFSIEITAEITKLPINTIQNLQCTVETEH